MGRNILFLIGLLVRLALLKWVIFFRDELIYEGREKLYYLEKAWVNLYSSDKQFNCYQRGLLNSISDSVKYIHLVLIVAGEKFPTDSAWANLFFALSLCTAKERFVSKCSWNIFEFHSVGQYLGGKKDLRSFELNILFIQ